MEGEELLENAIFLKQQSEEIEKQLNFVNEQLQEMEHFVEKLNILEKSDEKEFLANVGRGVYVKTERKPGEKLFVEAGAGVVLRKTPKEAKEIVSEQIKKFNEARIHLTAQLETCATQFGEMIRQVEKMRDEKNST